MTLKLKVYTLGITLMLALIETYGLPLEKMLKNLSRNMKRNGRFI